jgi:hypothetical protein
MARKSPLEDQQTAALAWARWRRIMGLVGAVTVVMIVAAVAWFHAQDEPVSIHFYIALALGIGGTMMLGGALMGLAFLSSGTGHDDSIGPD